MTFGLHSDRPGEEKVVIFIGGLFKNKVRTDMERVAAGRGLGLHFGSILASFLRSWASLWRLGGHLGRLWASL